MKSPRAAVEFNRPFSTEEACWDHSVKLRWLEGFRCPDCGSLKAWLTSNKLFRCGASKSAVFVTGGPIVTDTRPLRRRWIYAMWWGVGQKTTASASA